MSTGHTGRTISAVVAIGLTGLLACADPPTSGPAFRPIHLLAAISASSTLLANGVTSPGGTVILGGDVWIADHVNGFCRLDPAPSGSGSAINTSTCNANAVSPGQPSVAPISGSAQLYVFVPDNSSKGVGVYRLTWDPSVRKIIRATLLQGQNMGVFTGNRATATSIGLDGNLYVGTLRNGNIYRVTGITGATQTATQIGKTSDGSGVASLAFLGDTLYIAQKAAVTKMASSCTNNCTAISETVITSTGPLALASNGTTDLYISDTPGSGSTIMRFVRDPACVVGGYEEKYASGFGAVSGLSVAASGAATDGIYISDDPTQGGSPGAGHVYRLALGAAAEAPGSCASSPPPPPPPVSVTGGAGGGASGGGAPMQIVSGLTSPAGAITLLDSRGQPHYWVADHALGICRVDSTGTGYTLVTNTCSTAAKAAGQPSVYTSGGVTYVFVPDGSSKSQGVQRLTYNSAGSGTLGGAVLLANGQYDGSTAMGPLRLNSTAIDANGTLYVGGLKSGTIIRIPNAAAGRSATASSMGRTSDGRGILSLAFVGGNLYLAEASGVTEMRAPNITCPSGGCFAASAGLSATFPTALYGDLATQQLYIADTPNSASTLYRASVDPSSGDITEDPTPIGSGFTFATGLLVDAGKLLVGDDPSSGNLALQGRLWTMPLPPPIP